MLSKYEIARYVTLFVTRNDRQIIVISRSEITKQFFYLTRAIVAFIACTKRCFCLCLAGVPACLRGMRCPSPSGWRDRTAWNRSTPLRVSRGRSLHL